MEDIQVYGYQLPYFGAIFGAVIGLVPLMLGLLKRKKFLGLMGIITPAIGGGILGFFLSIPLVIVFTWLILDSQRSRKMLGLVVMICGLFFSGFGLIKLGFFGPPVGNSFNYGDIIAFYMVLAGIIFVVVGIILSLIGYFSKSEQNRHA